MAIFPEQAETHPGWAVDLGDAEAAWVRPSVVRRSAHPASLDQSRSPADVQERPPISSG